MITSRLGIYLFKHFAIRMLAFWGFLTIIVFSIGVIEILMSPNGNSGFVALADALNRRSKDLPEYLAETMAYAGYAGFLLSFWILWYSRELEQIRLMGARKLLLRAIACAAAMFGAIEVLAIAPFESELNVWQKDVRLVRQQQNGQKIILFAKNYNASDGQIKHGARILLADSQFNVRAIYRAKRGKITQRAWNLEKGTKETFEGKKKSFTQKSFTQKSFPIETDVDALAHVLQPHARAISVYELPAAYMEAKVNARPVRPFVNRALFFLHLPLVYIGFGFLAYAIALYLPPRGTNTQLALLIIFLPCTVKFIQHIAWSQVQAENLPAVLPALGLPLAFCCAAALGVRTQRLFI